MNRSYSLKAQIAIVEQWAKKAGKADLLHFLNGESLTRAKAIKAMCYGCVCGEDTEPCLVYTCPLHPFCQWNE